MQFLFIHFMSVIRALDVIDLIYFVRNKNKKTYTCDPRHAVVEKKKNF